MQVGEIAFEKQFVRKQRITELKPKTYNRVVNKKAFAKPKAIYGDLKLLIFLQLIMIHQHLFINRIRKNSF